MLSEEDFLLLKARHYGDLTPFERMSLFEYEILTTYELPEEQYTKKYLRGTDDLRCTF